MWPTSGSLFPGSLRSRPSPPGQLTGWQITDVGLPRYHKGLGERTYDFDLVMVTDTSVVGVSRATGAILWTVTPPKSGTAFCALSSNAANDQLALGYGTIDDSIASQAACSNIGLLNLKTHTLTWSIQVAPFVGSAGEAPSGLALTIAGGFVYAGGKAMLVRIPLANGSPQPLANQINPGDQCSVNDLAADSSTVYVLDNCTDQSDSGNETVLGLDAPRQTSC